MRGGYGRPLSSIFFGGSSVRFRVTGTLRTTLCSRGGAYCPPRSFFHTHVFVPQVSLSLSLLFVFCFLSFFLSQSLSLSLSSFSLELSFWNWSCSNAYSAWPLGPAFRNWSCQGLTSHCSKNALDECTEYHQKTSGSPPPHPYPRMLLMAVRGNAVRFFASAVFRRLPLLFPQSPVCLSFYRGGFLAASFGDYRVGGGGWYFGGNSQ